MVILLLADEPSTPPQYCVEIGQLQGKVHDALVGGRVPVALSALLSEIDSLAEQSPGLKPAIAQLLRQIADLHDVQPAPAGGLH